MQPPAPLHRVPCVPLFFPLTQQSPWGGLKEEPCLSGLPTAQRELCRPKLPRPMQTQQHQCLKMPSLGPQPAEPAHLSSPHLIPATSLLKHTSYQLPG